MSFSYFLSLLFLIRFFLPLPLVALPAHPANMQVTTNTLIRCDFLKRKKKCKENQTDFHNLLFVSHINISLFFLSYFLFVSFLLFSFATPPPPTVFALTVIYILLSFLFFLLFLFFFLLTILSLVLS